jgi:hypothetical protein
MTDTEIRAILIRDLSHIINRLPNGLLHRLLADAQFFEDWNLKKKRARGSARMNQYRSTVNQMEDQYWRKINREGSSHLH